MKTEESVQKDYTGHPAIIVSDQDLVDACVEAINLIDEKHRGFVMDAFSDDPKFAGRLRSSVIYIATRISISRLVNEEGLSDEDFIKRTFSDIPDFSFEHDIKIVMLAILDDQIREAKELSQIDNILNVSKIQFINRMILIKNLFLS